MVEEDKYQPCMRCNGTGVAAHIKRAPKGRIGLSQTWEDCYYCQGTGRILKMEFEEEEEKAIKERCLAALERLKAKRQAVKEE